jgi:hypothetical protein
MNQLLTYKDYIAIVESIATIAAIIVGGIWSYKIFIQKRQKYPRANIQHHISHRHIGNGKILLSIDVTITNDGEVLLPLPQGTTYLRALVPPPPALITTGTSANGPAQAQQHGWPLIAYQPEESGNTSSLGRMRRIIDTLLGRVRFAIELEPHEHEQLYYNFIIDDTVQTIQVETFFSNPSRAHRVGWRTTTLYDLPTTPVPTLAMIRFRQAVAISHTKEAPHE